MNLILNQKTPPIEESDAVTLTPEVLITLFATVVSTVESEMKAFVVLEETIVLIEPPTTPPPEAAIFIVPAVSAS